MLIPVLLTIEGTLWRSGPHPWNIVLAACWLFTMMHLYPKVAK